MNLGQMLLDGQALPGIAQPQRAEKTDRWLAKDARTDQAMVSILFQAAELLSQFRAWKRVARRLDTTLADSSLLGHPKRPQAVLRWETAADHVAEIELELWNLAPAAASCWLSYSPARRAEHARGGRWPPADASGPDAVEWFTGEWLVLARKGVN